MAIVFIVKIANDRKTLIIKPLFFIIILLFF